MAPKTSRKAEILNDLKEQSAAYAENATRLSSALEEVEQFFNELPGKVTVSTDCDDGEYIRISLDKTPDGWKLLLWDSEPPVLQEFPIRVIQASVYYKAAAAQLLPELYEKLVNHFSQMRYRVDMGLSRLKELPFLDLDDVDTTEVEKDSRNSIVEGVPSDEIPF
jgi:hypothetical protein